MPQQLIDQRRFAVIDVRNDSDITDLIHWGNLCRGGERPTLRETAVESNPGGLWGYMFRRQIVPTRAYSGEAVVILAAMTTNVSYWNWYGFPGVYTASYIVIEMVGFVLVGVVAALVLRKRSPGGLKLMSVST